MNVRDYLVVEIEIAPVAHVCHGAPAEIFDAAESVGVHVLRQTVNHVLHDTKAVMHRRGADLHGGGAQGDVFGSIIPEADTADTAGGNAHCFCHDRKEMQRNRFHCRTAIASVRGLASYSGPRSERL